MSRAIFPLLTFVALTSCSTSSPKLDAAVGRSGVGKAPRGELEGPPGLPAAELASLERANAPVAFAASEDGGLFLYVAGGKLYARKIEQKPTNAEPVAIGAVSTLGVSLAVKAKPDGSFVAFWDEKVDQNHILKLAVIGKDGKPVGAPLSLPPIAEASLAYADIALVGGRAIVVYELVREGRSLVMATPIAEGLSRVEDAAKPVVDGALAWHATMSDRGLAIAVVKNGASGKDGEPVLGHIDVVLVDAKGAASSPKPVLTTDTAQIDVEIAAIAGGYVVAWTDESLEEGAVRFVTLGVDGNVVGQPKWVAPPIGAQALVGLAASPTASRALIAWENIGQTSGTSRVLNLATTGSDGVLGTTRSRLLLDEAERPDLVADGEGFAALTLAPARLREGEKNPAPPSWPAIVRVSADLSVKWSEPVRFVGARAREGVPDMAWGLTCRGGNCYALAADDSSPASFFLVGSADRESSWQAPAWRADSEKPPKVLALRSMADGPRYASAQAVKLDGGSQALAWVTYFLDGSTPLEAAPKGEPPFAATLGLRFTGPDGTPGTPVIVSKRAVSVGGVSVAEGGKGKKAEAVVAWVAADKTGPQVYATKVDADGKKVAQKKITVVTRDKKDGDKPAKGAKADKLPPASPSSVAVVHSPAIESQKGGSSGSDGYVIAWVDPRDKNGELYVARVNKDLEKTVVDKRITNAKGDAADVSMAISGSDVFIAFADSRDDKASDIYFSHVDAFSLKEIDDDGRVYASLGPSRSPRVTMVGKRIFLAWIEESPVGDSKPSSLRVGEVDSAGRLIGAPKIVMAPDGGAVTGFSFTAGADLASARLALSWATTDGRLEMGAAMFDAAGEPGAIVRLGMLASGPFAEPSLSFADASAKSLFFAEDVGERGRLRQVELGW